MSRLRDVEGPASVRRARRSGGPSERKSTIPKGNRTFVVVWSICLAIVTALIICGFMMFWLKSHGSGDEDLIAERPVLVEENIRVASRFASPDEGQALDLVKQALAVTDPAKVESLFRLGGANPEEVVEFVKATGKRDGAFERMDWLSRMDVEGLQTDGVQVVFSGKKPAAQRLAFLVPDETGVWKVDFDSFARSSRPSWKELLEGGAQSGLVRVFVAKDAYFNGPYIDEHRWVCFGMISPDTKEYLSEDKELLHGYCRVDSPQAKAMERIFVAGNQLGRATLEIRHAEGGDPRQFEIARVLSEDWVLAPRAFDEKFK